MSEKQTINTDDVTLIMLNKKIDNLASVMEVSAAESVSNHRDVVTSIDDLAAMTARLENRLVLRMDQGDITLNNLGEKVGTLDLNMNDLVSKVDTLGGKFNNLEEKVDTLGGKFNNLEEKVDTLGEKFDGLEVKVDTLGAKVNTLESSVGNLSTTIDDLAVMTNNGFKEARKDMLAMGKELGNRIDYIALNYMPREKV